MLSMQVYAERIVALPDCMWCSLFHFCLQFVTCAVITKIFASCYFVTVVAVKG